MTEHIPAAGGTVAEPKRPAEASATRTCVIPNFGPDELDRVLRLFEELARTLMWWESDAQGPDGNGWRPPAACSGTQLEQVHTRLWQQLRSTQTRHDWDGANRVDVEPDGPEWYAQGDYGQGGYGLANLFFIDLATADLQALDAFAAALAGPQLDSVVQEAVDDVNEREVDEGGHDWTKIEQRRQTYGAAAAVIRLNALLNVTPDPADLALLQRALDAAPGSPAEVRLDTTEEAAWHRVVDACHKALFGGPGADRYLSRWAMGTRDHT